MKFIVWWQDQHHRWHRYQELHGETSAYNTARNRTKQTGKRHRLTDGEGRLLDLFDP